MPRHQPTSKGRDEKRPAAGGTAAPGGFSRLVLEQLARDGASHRPALIGEDLAHLDYSAEVALKDAAFNTFWKRARLGATPRSLAPSPRPRGYRTTSKRRVESLEHAACLFLGDRKAHRDTPVFVESALEPAEHAALFRFLQAKLSESAFRVVARHLTWIVVRGSYQERAVIFNVDTLFGPLVRKLKNLGQQLAALDPPVTAAYIYVDESGSDYYLEVKRSSRALTYKKLFGPEQLRVKYGELGLSFHPTSFCQVNESIVPHMLRLAAEMLEPQANDRLLDLYCGYGLFSHALAGRVREVIGLDAAGPSIESARDNARRLGQRASRFVATRISMDAIRKLPAPGDPELVILDPPRNGTERGVIGELAARGPRRVLHVFCSVDDIPGALSAWKAGGYVPARVAPIDMFPGTPHLEVFVELERTSAGR